jgi:hypothetical protein
MQRQLKGNRALTVQKHPVAAKPLRVDIGPLREWNGDIDDPDYQSWLNEGRAEESQLCRMSGTIQR